MAYQFKNNLNAGINLDVDLLRMPANAAVFIKNLTNNININAGTPAQSGQDSYVFTPMEGNAPIAVSLPSGVNYCVGFYSSEQTNEGYFCVYNDGGNHQIYVISGDTGTLTLVYHGTLPFVSDPQFFLCEGRMTLELKSYINPVTGLESNYKFLIFTNNTDHQYWIEVQSSIATSSYSTSYFTTSAAYYDPIELTHMGVVTPLKAMSVTPVAPVTGDAQLQNLLIRNGWQFRVKFIDIFGRESEHGIISAQYITIVGGGCVSVSNGLSRCVMLQFDKGNPLINQIQVEFRQWVGDDRAGALQSGWSICETLNVYKEAPGVAWYNRVLNPDLDFSGGSNTIKYKFCADKGNTPINTEETSRTEPELPRISSSVASINKRLLLANNIRGFQPVDPAQISKVTFNAITPSTHGTCAQPPTCTIIIFAEIYNLTRVRPGMVYLKGTVPVFGYPTFSPASDPLSYDLNFGNGQTGFTGYLTGFPGSVVSKQVDFNKADGTWVEQATLSTPGGWTPVNCPMQMFVFDYVPAGEYIFRIASHKVSVGEPNLQQTSTYVGGIVSISDLQNYPLHIIAANPLKEIAINACGISQGDVITLNGFSASPYNDPTTTPVLLILDPTASGTVNALVDGYLNEDNQDNNPIEMLPINGWGVNGMGGYTEAFGSFFTDHNGFYFSYGPIGNGVGGSMHVQIEVDACVGPRLIPGGFPLSSTANGVVHGLGTGSSGSTNPDVHGFWGSKIYVTNPGAKFPDCGRRYINGRVTLCDGVTGVGSVPAAMTKCSVSYTDSNGYYSIIAHNRYNGPVVYYSISDTRHMLYAEEVLDWSTYPYNTDIAIVITRGNCTLTACGGCTYCFSGQVVSYEACVTPDCGTDRCAGSPGCISCRITALSPILAKINGVNISGVQSGGRYPVGFILHDVIGRHTFVQIAQGAGAYVDIPAISSYEAFLLCKIGFTIDPSTVFDSIFTKMTLVVGSNVNFSDFFSWTCDYIQKVDYTGQTNDVNPTQIRLYYGSNNEYQKEYNFSTNVGWQFITNPPPPATPVPVEGDYIEFIINGDGNWFLNPDGTPKRIISQVTYDQVGTFITIDYTEDLKNLQQFALFKIVRPIQNKPQFSEFYEQALTIELIDGVPQTLSGTLPYTDSYMLGRILPIPLAAGLSDLSDTAFQYTNVLDQTTVIATPITTYAGLNNNKNGVIIMSASGFNVDIQQSFFYLFESPSPADTWGSHISDRGRIFTINPYEAQQRSGTEIALSDALGDRGVLNGLSYFRSKNIQTFDRNAWGDIYIVLVEVGVCMVLCNNDYFLTRYNQSQLQISSDGQVLGQNTAGELFTQPQTKVGSNYGITPQNLNTLQRYNGRVVWLDAKGHLIFSNFNDAKPMEKDGYLGYLLNKIAAVNINNLDGSKPKQFFIGGIDPKTMEYMLTSFAHQSRPDVGYINTQSQPDVTANETLIFDLTTGMLKSFASFTPEFYGRIPGYFLQKQFLSFKQGIAYLHHNNFGGSIAPPAYANFYGYQAEVRITHVVNGVDGKELPEKVKRFLANEVYCRQGVFAGRGTLPVALFYADQITSEKGQLSRLAIARWVQKDGVWSAEYLCAINTPRDPNMEPQTTTNALLDGDPLQGRWLLVSLTSNPAWTGTYFELSSLVNYFNSLEKSAD